MHYALVAIIYMQQLRIIAVRTGILNMDYVTALKLAFERE
jgi:hypothetical protein